jgi:hypothetical protein
MDRLDWFMLNAANFFQQFKVIGFGSLLQEGLTAVRRSAHFTIADKHWMALVGIAKRIRRACDDGQWRRRIG